LAQRLWEEAGELQVACSTGGAVGLGWAVEWGCCNKVGLVRRSR